jgi:cephalosporin-C deacetylase-like acetyl esterase
MKLAAIESFTPLRNEPADFDAFWNATHASILEIEPKPVLARQKAPAAGLVYDQLHFTSLGDVRVSGYLLRHDVAEPRPLIVHSHGYNSQYDVMLNWANSGCNVLGIDFRGFGRSERLGLARGGYILTGIESPQTSVLRGAAMDLVQALRAGREILGAHVGSVTLYGFSFGGAMALTAGALDGNIDLLVTGQPTLGWNSERLRLSTAGSAAELNRFLEDNPAQRDKVMQTLNYFDTMHFASRLEVPTLIGIGLDDDVVPSRSVFAVTNHAGTAALELRILPVSHSADPRESLWAEFDQEWLRMARTGVPADFASNDRRLRSIEAAA